MLKQRMSRSVRLESAMHKCRQTLTVVCGIHDTLEEKVSDHPFQPTCRSARIGELLESCSVTMLPVQKGRNLLYESTSAISGYNDEDEYLSVNSFKNQAWSGMYGKVRRILIFTGS